MTERTPEEVAPSGVYGFRRLQATDEYGPVVQVVEYTNGRTWLGTPARYYASAIAAGVEGVAIDHGQNWFLPREDVQPFVRFARQVVADAALWE